MVHRWADEINTDAVLATGVVSALAGWLLGLDSLSLIVVFGAGQAAGWLTIRIGRKELW